MRSTAKLNHVLGRFWGTDFKFRFRSDMNYKQATADGENIGLVPL